MSSLCKLHLNSFVCVWKKDRNISERNSRQKNRLCSMCVLHMAILQGNLPALNNVKIFLRDAVAQQVTEPEKFNLPTVKYVLSVSESSNSIQNYFLNSHSGQGRVSRVWNRTVYTGLKLSKSIQCYFSLLGCEPQIHLEVTDLFMF